VWPNMSGPLKIKLDISTPFFCFLKWVDDASSTQYFLKYIYIDDMLFVCVAFDHQRRWMQIELGYFRFKKLNFSIVSTKMT